MPIKPYAALCYFANDDYRELFRYLYKRLLSKYNRHQLHNILDEIVKEHGCLFDRSIAMLVLFRDEYPDENE